MITQRQLVNPIQVQLLTTEVPTGNTVMQIDNQVPPRKVPHFCSLGYGIALFLLLCNVIIILLSICIVVFHLLLSLLRSLTHHSLYLFNWYMNFSSMQLPTFNWIPLPDWSPVPAFSLGCPLSVSAWFPLPTSCISLMASTQVWSWKETIKCLQYQILSSCILPLSHYSSRMESRWFSSEFFCITAVFSKISYFSMLRHCRIEHLF